MKSIEKNARVITWMLTLCYFAIYMTRINFAVMIVKICSDMALPKTELAIVLTGMTVFYGTGQIVNGILGDKIRAERMITAGLILASVCNVAITLCGSPVAMTAVWCVNGFAHSMLWPPIVRLMSTYLSDEEYGYAAVRVSWGSSFATVALYLLCPVLLAFIPWKAIMIICASLGIAVSIVWTLINPKILKSPKTNSRTTAKAAPLGERKPLPKYVFVPLFMIMLGIILQGILRDGVTNWMPSYMCESFGLSEESAIVTAVIPAIFSIISFAAFDYMHRKLFKNEVTCAAVIFVGAAVAAAALYAVGLFGGNALISTVLIALIIAFMHGINLMLITVVPKRFLKSGKVSTYSGILNACTYIGASLSNYGFAVLAETKGWSFTILSWVIISVCGLAICFAAVPLWNRFTHDYAEGE